MVIRHLLQLAAVLGDGEVVLGEGVEGSVEVDGPGLSVSPELGLESDPGLTSHAPTSRMTSCSSTVSALSIQDRTMLSIRN